MNGIVLLVALAGPAVDYSYRTTPDRQQEYTIQIEPEILRPLATGEQIQSDVPPEAGQIQRLCIRIGMTPVTHTAAGEQVFRQLLVSAGRVASADRALVAADTQTTILWPARTNPEQSYGITYGWQPDVEGQLAYYVQIDPTVLRTLSAGDEIHATVDPAAGRVGRFVVTSGTKPLPQIASTTTPATNLPSSTAPLAGANSRSRFGSNTGTSPAPFSNVPPAGAPARVPDYGPLPANDVSSRSAWGGAATDYSRPAVGGTQFTPTTGGPALTPAGSYNSRDLAPLEPPRQSYVDPSGRTAGGYSPAGWENQVADNRGYAQQPAAHGGGLFDRSQVAPQPQSNVAPAQGYGQTPGFQQAPGGNAQQPTVRYSPPPPDNRVASLPPGPTMTPVANNGFGQNTAMQPAADKPWGPLLFVTFALFFSIGGNLYLAYTALEFHNRYRSAIDRLRSAARSA